MKKILLFGVFLLMGCISAFGQDNSVSGYVITNDDIVIECEIFDADWKSNPTEFSYKPYGLLSRVRTGNPQCVKEFVADTTRYVSAEVDAGLLSGLAGILSGQSAQDYGKKTVFLKELAAGSPALYQHSDGIRSTFYYTLDGVEYLELENNQNLLGSLFPADILKNINLGKILTAGSLKDVFDKVNGKKKKSTPIFTSNTNRKSRKTVARPGLYAVANAGTANLFTAGLEFEYPLPSRPRKVAVALETSYFHYMTTPADGSASIGVNGLRIPVTGRYYFNLLGKTRIYANVFAGLDVPFGSSLSIDGTNVKTTPTVLYGAGAGIVKGNFRIGVRYNGNGNYVSVLSNYDTSQPAVSLSIAYKFL